MRLIEVSTKAALAAVALFALAVAGCIIRPPPPVTVTASAPPPVTVSAPPPPVVAAPSPSSGSGMISYPGERVRYPLPIGHTRTVDIYVQGFGLDPTVSIYDAYGNRVGFNDDGGSGLDSHIVLTLVPGNYVVEVAGYSSSTGSFNLMIR